MKKFIKKYKLNILSTIILIIWGISNVIICCNEKLISSDPIITYYHMIVDLNLYYLPILAPLFIIVPAIYEFHCELHTGTIKNYLLRTKYKKYMLKKYLNSLKNSLILPLFVVFLILCSCLITKSIAFGSGSEFYGYILAAPEKQYASIIGIFMIVYIFNIFLHSIFYVNLGLIYSKKYSNMLVNIVLSYLTFIGVNIVLEVFIGNILNSIFNVNNLNSVFNLFNIWTYSQIDNLYMPLLVSTLLVIVSSIFVYLIYNNKERVISEIE